MVMMPTAQSKTATHELHLGDKAGDLARKCYASIAHWREGRPIEGVGYQDIRAFLSGPYGDAMEQDVAAWGNVVEQLLHRIRAQKAFDAQDARLIGRYFGAMTNLLNRLPTGNEGKSLGSKYYPLVDCLNHMRCMDKIGLRMGQSFLDTGTWTPDALMQALHRAHDGTRSSAIEYLTRIAMSWLAHTSWQPENPTLFAKVWELHFPEDALDRAGWATFFGETSTYLHGLPMLLPQALDALSGYVARQDWGGQMIPCFFPMPLRACEAHDFLASLGHLFEVSSPPLRSDIEALLTHHHPELGQLLALHFALAPEPMYALTYLQAQFKAIRGEPVASATMMDIGPLLNGYLI